VSREQLVDIAILIGTDYNPEGVKGIGPKKAYKLVKQLGDLEKVLKAIGKSKADFPVDPDEIRNVFMNPEVTDDYEIEWRGPDLEGILEFLCDERDFSKDRVKKALERVEKARRKARETKLTAFFGQTAE
jgi:flap endonuclease-1